MRNKLAGMLLGMLLAGSSYATTISIQPAIQTLSPGQAFQINVDITDVADLYAFQFDLNFDPAFLSAALVSEGTFLSTGGTTFFVPGTIDNVAGTISFTSDSLIGAIPGVTGSGTLATVEFTALAAGMTSLDISNGIFLDSTFTSVEPGAPVGAAVAIPEPATLGLLFAGLGLGAFLRRQER